MTTIITHVRLFDGLTVYEDQTIVINASEISSISPASSAAAASFDTDANIVDGSSHTLLPGLIDAHVHTAIDRLKVALKFGVTTELEMMGYWSKEDRELIANSDDMADLRSASFGLTAPGGHPSELHAKVKKGKGGGPPPGQGRGGGAAGGGPGRGGGEQGQGGQGHKHRFVAPTASSKEEAVSFVDERVAEGADYIKIMIEEGSVLDSPGLPLLPVDILAAAVQKAHQHSKLAIAHVLTLPATQTALDIGIDGLAHLFIDQPHTPEIISSLASAGVFVTPCLSLNATLLNTHRSKKLAADSRVSSRLPENWLSTLSASFNTFPTGSFADNLSTVKALHDAGVDILAGTDVSVPIPEFGGLAHGASVHQELQLFVEAGLTPIDALKTATSVPARRFQLSDRGTIEVGKRADLLLVKGDPTKDIGDTLNIEGIWRRGVRFTD